MLRAVVIAVLALGACKSSERAAGDLGTAGKVLEVAGDVKVAGKPLAVGQGLGAEDVIDTGADGRVVIVLAQNNARWQLGPNKHVKLRDSIAWDLPKQSGSAAVVTQEMAAAGRQAERSAADTAATAPTQAAAPQVEPPAPTVQPAEPPPPPPPPPHRAPAKDVAPESKSAASHVTRGGDNHATRDDAADGDLEPAGAVKVEQDAPKLVASPKFKACIAGHHGIQLDLEIAADGKATVKLAGPVDDKTRACVEQVVAAQTFPKRRASLRMQLP